jgi:hypothetical protein
VPIAVFFAARYLMLALLSPAATLVLGVAALAEKGAAGKSAARSSDVPDPPDHR